MLHVIAPKILELVSDCLKEEKFFAVLKAEIKPVNNYIYIYIYIYLCI